MNCPHQSHKTSNQPVKSRRAATSLPPVNKPKPKTMPSIARPKPAVIKPKPLTPVVKNAPSMIKKLKWSDFKGRVPQGIFWLAYTYWSYSHDYKVVKTSDPNKVKIQLQVRCDLGAKSWVSSPHDSLLNHEQGHYDIACLCMLNFKKRVVEQEFNRLTCKDDIERLYKDVVKEFGAKQIQYDKETRHYLDREEQERWDKYLAEELKALSIYEFMDVTKT